MRAAWAIARKDLRVYLTTPTSYVLLGAFALIVAFFFQRLVVEYQLRQMQYLQMQAPAMAEAMNLTDWVMAPLLMNITVFFLFMLPILTMRLLAEERRGRTFELLMTTPLRPYQIVLGKYVAGVVMMAAMLAVTAVFPALLAHFGASEAAPALDARSVAVAYGGMFLLGAAFVAVGLAASSISESQVVAVVLSFALLMLLYVVGLAARGEDGAWSQVLAYLAVTNHQESFLRGVVRLGDVVYCLSLAFVGLLIACRVVEAQRWR